MKIIAINKKFIYQSIIKKYFFLKNFSKKDQLEKNIGLIFLIKIIDYLNI